MTPGRSLASERSSVGVFGSICALFLIRVITENEELFFGMSVLLFAGLMVKGAKVRCPRIPGFGLFSVLVVSYGVLGLYANPPRDVVRDAYYILPSLLWVIIAYVLATNLELRNNRSMLKTLYLYGLMVTISCYVRFALSGTFSFNGIRGIFVAHVYDVGFIIPIIAYNLLLEGRYFFSRRADGFILLLLVSQVVFSLGRTSILQPLINLSVLLILILFAEGVGAKSSKILALLVGLVLLTVCALRVMPSEAVSILLDKLGNSVVEVNGVEQIGTVEEAMNSWRAYEIQSAWRQWSAAPLHVQLFGGFLGAGTEIGLVPYNWDDIVTNGQIPLLHNGFVTVLPKFGIVGFFVFISIYASSILIGLRLIAVGGQRRTVGYFLTALMVTSVFVTYVVRGPIAESAFFAWAVLLGWLVGCSGDVEPGSVYRKNGVRQTGSTGWSVL